MTFHRLIAAVLAILALWGAAALRAEPTAPEVPLRYRKVFVPADQVEQWPRAASRYVPVDAAEFQRLLAAAARRSDDAEVPPAALLASARYTAQLTDDGLLEGEAQWDVRHDGREPVLVPLTPCGIALSQPQWVEEKIKRTAVLGTDRDGALRLVVTKAGTLAGLWSLRADRPSNGELSFTLALPSAASSRLTLDLPDTKEPRIEGAAIMEIAGASKGNRRWQIPLGDRPALVLRVMPSDQSVAAAPRGVVRQSMLYDFSPRGVEITARLSVSVGPRPMQQLLVQLSTGLHLLDAKLGDAALNWTRRSTSDGKLDQIVVELPESLENAQRVIQLRAVAPLALGKVQALPTMAPQEMLWQEGTATLLVLRPLLLGELNLTGCRQSKVEPLAGAAGDALTLQCFAPDARIEVRLDRPEPMLQLTSATAIDLNPREIQARFVADCSVEDSERFTFEAVMMPGWQVDQVESEPVGSIEHWSIVNRGGQVRLVVRFARALTPKRPLRVVVHGRLGRSPLSEPLAHGVLRMIDVEQANWKGRLIGLAASKPHQLQVRGDEDLIRLDPKGMDAEERQRLGAASRDLVYRDDAGASRLQAGLVRQPAGHLAEIEVLVQLSGGMLVESARIVCRPDSGGLDRLLVHASQVRAPAMQWLIKDDPTAHVVGRRLSDAQQRDAGYSGGETWEILFERPRTAEFELQARREVPFVSGIEASLLSVAPMAEQRGVLAIHCDAGQSLDVENLRLLPIPTEAGPTERLNTVRGSFRYDPERDASLPQSMLVLVRPKSGALTPGAIAWTAAYEARWQTDGVVQHQLTLHVENQGRRQIRIDLPPTASLEQIAVDGAAQRRAGDERPQSVLVELDPGRRKSDVQLDYVSRGGAWSALQRLRPLLPTADIPILGVSGRIWAPPGYRALWSSGLAGSTAADGWRAFPLESGGLTSPVIVVREPLWIAAGWSAFLLAALGLWWLYPRKLRAWGLLICALAIFALLLPAPLSEVATTLLLGTVVAAALKWLAPPGTRWLVAAERASRQSWVPGTRDSLPSTLSQQQLQSQVRDPRVSAGSSVRRGLAMWLVAMLLAGPEGDSQAEGPAADKTNPATIFQVLVPIGKDRKPSGDTWYVPIELYQALNAQAAARSVERHGWLTTGVNYRGRLDWNASQTRLQWTELVATYEVETFGRETQVRFPLSRKGVTLSPLGARLDGSSIQGVWDQQGKSLLVDVAQSGRHRIELSLTPMAQETDAPTVEIDSPALPTAQLKLTVPASAPALRVATALGRVQYAEESRQLTAQLGGTAKVVVGWSQPSANGATADLDVEQLVWLKIAPGAVSVEARLKLRGFESRRQRIEVAIDPCLRFLGASSAAGPIEARVVPGAPQTVVLESSRGIAADEELTLSLLWVEASGLGRLRVPLVAPLAARSIDGWFAVSIDKSLSYDVPAGSDLPAATSAELAAHWPLEAAAMDLAYRLPREPVAWQIATEPREPQIMSRDALGLSLSSDTADARYWAALETTGSLFQYRLHVPKECLVTKVELTQEDDDEDRVARWSQAESLLTIRLKQPATGRQRLSLRGNWRLAGAKIAPPDFHLEDCQRESFDLALFRRPGIEVQTTDTEAVHELIEPTTELLRLVDRAPRWFGRLVGSYRVVNPQATSVFAVRPSPPQVAATEVLTLSRLDGIWQATADCQWQVVEGMIDTIRFQIPSSWRGPFEITPPQPYSVVEIPDQRQRQLVIRPREAVRDGIQLTISSPLALAAGQRVAAPAIVPLDVVKLEQFVVLPKQVEQERVEWELRGLERQPLPPDRDRPPLASESASSYRVVGGRFQAALASVAKIERAPRVRLADVRLGFAAGGQRNGMAAFDLEPAGLWQCVVRAPAGVRPVRVTVGALPATLVPLQSNAWQISLISNQLPQRIEMVFQGDAAQPGIESLAAPWISAPGGPIAVEQTLWTVYGPPATSLQPTSNAAATLSAEELQWLRLDSVGATLADANADESADILARWYDPWSSELCESWRQIESLAPAAGPRAEAIKTRLRDNRKRQEQIARRLRTSDVLDRAMHANDPPRPATASWELAQPASQSTPLCLAAPGAMPELTVQARTILSGTRTTRWLLAGWLASLTALLFFTSAGRRGLAALENRRARVPSDTPTVR